MGVRKEERRGAKAGEKFELFGGLRTTAADAGGGTTDKTKKDEEEAPAQNQEVEMLVEEALATTLSKPEAPQNERETKEEVEEAVKRPPMDLFKSIFLDSSDDEERDDDEGEDKETEKKDEKKMEKGKEGKADLFGKELEPTDKTKKMPWEEEKKNLLRNTNPAK